MRSGFGLKQVSTIIFACLITFIIFFMFSSMMSYSSKNDEKQADKIVDIIRRSAVQCYALEGSYPPSLDYLARKYELILDEDRFIYHYDCQIGNRMPDIMVKVKPPKGK